LERGSQPGELITMTASASRRLLTTASWGHTPIEDWQFGGGIISVAAGIIFFTATIFLLLHSRRVGHHAAMLLAVLSIGRAIGGRGRFQLG
jgi:hypothetical protein